MNMINSYSQEVTELLNTATIYGINGPVIYLKGNTGFRMSEMVYVGKEKLVGEVIALTKDMTTVQVYDCLLYTSYKHFNSSAFRFSSFG